MKLAAQILIVGLLVLYGASCKNDLTEINRLFAPEMTGVEVAKDVEMLYSDSAVVRVKVTGPKMLRHIDKNEPRQEFPEGVEVLFYDGNMQVTSSLIANYALRMERDNEVIVRDSVVWVSGTGEQLETSELIWDEKAGRMYTNKFVVIKRPEEIIYGYGFEADQDFKRSRIKAIEGRIKVDELNSGLKN